MTRPPPLTVEMSSTTRADSRSSTSCCMRRSSAQCASPVQGRSGSCWGWRCGWLVVGGGAGLLCCVVCCFGSGAVVSAGPRVCDCVRSSQPRGTRTPKAPKAAPPPPLTCHQPCSACWRQPRCPPPPTHPPQVPPKCRQTPQAGRPPATSRAARAGSRPRRAAPPPRRRAPRARRARARGTRPRSARRRSAW